MCVLQESVNSNKQEKLYYPTSMEASHIWVGLDALGLKAQPVKEGYMYII